MLVSGVVLGFAGAFLDFFSGYLILSQSSASAGEMGMVTASGASSMIWGIGLVALGAVLGVTSLTLGLRASAFPMNDFGALMVVYGLVMLFIGGSMYSGITPMTNGAFLPSFAMIVVGALMMANGALMWHSYIQQKMA